MNTFYFTFGTASEFPYQRGWVEAKNDAANIFNIYFPPRKDNVVNCAFIYSKEEWAKTDMGKGMFPDAKIGILEERA